MKKCLLFLGVLSLAFTAGSAIRCYACLGDDCKDPYSGNSSHVVTCPFPLTHCGKIDVDNGEQIQRYCDGITVSSSSTENKKFQDILAGRQNNDVVFYYCNGADLCNGSGRLAEISTMMILLPASLVLLISYFSRL